MRPFLTTLVQALVLVLVFRAVMVALWWVRHPAQARASARFRKLLAGLEPAPAFYHNREHGLIFTYTGPQWLRLGPIPLGRTRALMRTTEDDLDAAVSWEPGDGTGTHLVWALYEVRTSVSPIIRTTEAGRVGRDGEDDPALTLVGATTWAAAWDRAKTWRAGLLNAQTDELDELCQQVRESVPAPPGPR